MTIIKSKIKELLNDALSKVSTVYQLPAKCKSQFFFSGALFMSVTSSFGGLTLINAQYVFVVCLQSVNSQVLAKTAGKGHYVLRTESHSFYMILLGRNSSKLPIQDSVKTPACSKGVRKGMLSVCKTEILSPSHIPSIPGSSPK